jgi:hypothetical protein
MRSRCPIVLGEHSLSTDRTLTGGLLTFPFLLDRCVHGFGAIFPEFEILLAFVAHQIPRPYTKASFLQQLCEILALGSLPPQDVFEGGFLIDEDSEMIRYDVAVFAGRTCDKDGAVVIDMLRDAVSRPV